MSKKIPERAAASAFFFLQGFLFSSWGSRIPTVRAELGLNEAALGAILFAIPVGQLVTMPLVGNLVTRNGSRRSVMHGMLLYAFSLVALGQASSIPMLALSLFLFGIGGSFMNIAINAQGVGIERRLSKSIMASFHGFWSLAGFTGGAVGAVMIATKIGRSIHFAAAALAVLAIGFSLNRFLGDDDAVVPPARDERRFRLPDRRLMGLGLVAFFALFCEGTMFDWSGVYFQTVIGAHGGWIATGFTAFMSTMAGCRFLADSVVNRFGARRTVGIAGFLNAIGMWTAVAWPTVPTGIAGFLVVGAGVSSVIPLLYSAAGRLASQNLLEGVAPGQALAAVSSVGFLGFLVGPPFIGFIAQATSLRVAFFAVGCFGIVVALLGRRLLK